MTDFTRPPAGVAHRFVPTLTEVVHPGQSMALPAASPAPVVPVMSQELLEEIVDEAIRRAENQLTQKLPELLTIILHEQALAVSERLRREIKTAVRQAVTAALSERMQDLRVVRKGGDPADAEP